MQVEDIMTSPAITVSLEATLQEAIRRMLRHRIGSVVVTDSAPVGILTRSDVLRTVHRTGSVAEQTAADGMSTDLVTTSPTTTVQAALDRMEDHGIKKLPVLDELDLVGIVTMTDIARHQPERVQEVRDDLERRDRWTD